MISTAEIFLNKYEGSIPIYRSDSAGSNPLSPDIVDSPTFFDELAI